MPPRRQLQELRATFHGWPRMLLLSYLWKHWRLPDRDIVLRTRTGSSIHAPLRHNIGSLYTAFEVFAFGAYGDDWDDLGENPFVLDIGANLGAFMVWLGERYPRVEGLAFEPDPEAFAYLRRNLRANQLDGVKALSAAVGSRTGTAALHRTGYGDGTSSLLATSSVSEFTQSITVNTVAFDEAVADADRHIDVLKLDCEGAEYDIVLNSDEESWRQIERVTLEYHPVAGHTVADLKRRFEDLGYGVTREEPLGEELGMLWVERVGS